MDVLIALAAGIFSGGGVIFYIMSDGIKYHYYPNAYCHGWNDAKAGRKKAYH